MRGGGGCLGSGGCLRVVSPQLLICRVWLLCRQALLTSRGTASSAADRRSPGECRAGAGPRAGGAQRPGSVGLLRILREGSLPRGDQSPARNTCRRLWGFIFNYGVVVLFSLTTGWLGFPPSPRGAPLAAACSCASLPPPGPAWELRLLFDLVCFGLLIKHVLCFVGGASRSGAERFTHPLYSFLSHRCAAAPRRGNAGGGRRRGGPGPAPPHRRKEPSNPPSSSHASPRQSQAFSPFCTSVAVPPVPSSPCPFPPWFCLFSSFPASCERRRVPRWQREKLRLCPGIEDRA